jgi:tetratricopeptide (TPR) repeat protein
MSRVDTTGAGVVETAFMDQKSSDFFSARRAPSTTTAAAAFAQALALHQAGRLTDAEKIYRQILAAQPTHFDSLHLLGVIFMHRGDAEAAVRQIEAVLKVEPRHILALNNRGNALQQLRRFDEALASYDRALAIRSDYAEALINRGAALTALRRYDDALRSCDRAVELRPDLADAHVNRGSALHALNRFTEAVSAFDRSLTLRPNYAQAHYNRGNTLYALKRYEEALASVDAALALRPDYVEALTNRGAVLHALDRDAEALASRDRAIALEPNNVEAFVNRGVTCNALKRYDEALACCERALCFCPNHLDALTNRGVALHDLARFEEALASHDRALALRPDFAEALSNRGITLQELRRFDEALTSHDRALALRPDFAEAHSNRGNVLQELRRFDEALTSYDRALALRPNFPDGHFNATACRLLLGDFARGWQELEWRCETAQLEAVKRHFLQPLWTGAYDLAGKTILLHAEQGFGDAIQFCRYVPQVVECAAHVILEVRKPLCELMSGLTGTAQIVPRGEALPDFDLHCPLLSLPLAFRTRLETIPSQTPYLSAPEHKMSAWRDRLSTHELGKHETPRVGLVWAGDPRKSLPGANRIDRQRSLQFDQLAPALEVRDCEFYSLQKGDDAQAQLRSTALSHRVTDWSADFHDFSDTAALIENLDLVIAVDTAVAHLAGALGKPLWLINRYNTCWRWLLDRDDSPWYPTARLFRQDETRDWHPVITRIASALRDYVHSVELDRRAPSSP